MKSIIIILLGVIGLAKVEKVTPRKFIARKVIVELSKAGYTVSSQKACEMMGDCGVWTQWGSWSECPLCKKPNTFVTQQRTRECQVDGIPKNDCANFPDNIRECRVPICMCPEGWTQLPSVKGKCYQISNTAMDFDDAAASCLRSNAKLAEPMNYIESHELYELAKPILSTKSFWIGVTDRNVEGEYRLLSNGQPSEYFNWADNEPNNWPHEKTGKDQDCVTIGEDGTEKWDDEWCTHGYEFACEKPALA